MSFYQVWKESTRNLNLCTSSCFQNIFITLYTIWHFSALFGKNHRHGKHLQSCRNFHLCYIKSFRSKVGCCVSAIKIKSFLITSYAKWDNCLKRKLCHAFVLQFYLHIHQFITFKRDWINIVLFIRINCIVNLPLQ